MHKDEPVQLMMLVNYAIVKSPNCLWWMTMTSDNSLYNVCLWLCHVVNNLLIAVYEEVT